MILPTRRDLHAAWQAGRGQGLRSAASSTCPYLPGRALDAWMAGWRSGREERLQSRTRSQKSESPSAKARTPGSEDRGRQRSLPHHTESAVPGGARKPSLRLTVQSASGFSGSCLPRTIALAVRCEATLLKKLRHIDSRLPFEDRVLIWLAPHWEVDVEMYHRANGHQMLRLFQEHQLRHLDEYYEHELSVRLRIL